MASDRDTDGAYRRFATDAAPALFRTAWLLAGDWHLAEDLVQDCLARMYTAWPGIGRIDNPAAYAQTVLVRQFLTHRRRRSSGERPTDRLPETGETGPDTDLRVALTAALGQLPDRDRAVVVLRYLADRSVEQVAADIGRSPGAVRIQAMRALAKLRAVLGDTLADLRQN
jgi:RNA polymerase sigma-70 factor (sigma-E family)